MDALYSRRIYPPVQRALTSLSNAVPVALLDLLGGLVLAWLAFAAWRDWRGAPHRAAAARSLLRVAATASALYLMFLAAWGLNYRRAALRERVAYDASAVTAGAARRLAAAAVDRLNVLHAPAHAEGWPEPGAIDRALARSFDGVARDLAGSAPVPGRPKHTVLDWYFRRAGVSGMTDPWFLETLTASDLLPFERPLVVAHEWSHLAGLANEGEANVAGWLACVTSTAPNEYSGWLFMYSEAMGAIPTHDRTALAARLAEGPRADLTAVRDRIARSVSPRIANAGWRVYDSYLKANRVEAGARSYDEVVQLALGLKAAQVF